MKPDKVQRLDPVDQIDNVIQIGLTAGKRIMLKQLGSFEEWAATA
jgi:hypothetical protein